MAHIVKNLPAKQETGFQPLGREDPLEKEMAAYSSTLAWRISWTEAGYSPWGRRVGHDWMTSLSGTFTNCPETFLCSKLIIKWVLMYKVHKREFIDMPPFLRISKVSYLSEIIHSNRKMTN